MLSHRLIPTLVLVLMRITTTEKARIARKPFFSTIEQMQEDGEEEVIAVDALTFGRRAPTFVLPEPNIRSYIVVSRSAFDDDLLRAFPSRDVGRAVREQLLLDAPRCDVEVEGARVHRTIPSALDVSKLALCTQAVVGLPVELLHRSVGLVMEPPRQQGGVDAKLTIKVSQSGDFSAHKRLVVYRHDDGARVPILLFVLGSSDDVHMHIIPGGAHP